LADEITGRSRDELIGQYSTLAKVVATKIIQRLPNSVELDDLISAGIIGLIDAIDKYDYEKSKNFRKYAEIRIRGAIIDELRSMDWVSRTMRRQSAELEKTKKAMRHDLGREATDEEMAEKLELNLDQYFTLARKLQPVLLVSLDDLGINSPDEKRHFTQYLRDPKAIDPSVATQVNQLRTLLSELVGDLPDKQRIVVSLYYFDALNLKEIGKVLDVTESRVSQLHAQAVKSLKGKVRSRASQSRSS
jgi:RNA polymerase sigma factor for flagellar operon FliA